MMSTLGSRIGIGIVTLTILLGQLQGPLSAEQINVWPGKPPGETAALPPEADTSGPDGRNVAGRAVIRLGNVSTPTLEIYQPTAAANTGTAIVICPGGGHRILAYDLEGTEVAQWLQSIGVTGIVLKYRVPARSEEKRWEASVQDAQRAMSVVRQRAADWGIAADRIGIMGFSAGGQAAALTTLLKDRQYAPVDDTDSVDWRPSFAALIYPAYLVNKERDKLVPEAVVDATTPPLFLVHAFDDPVPCESSVLLHLAARRAQRPAELHVFSTGGHGYGMRHTEDPVTHWPDQLQAWLARNGWLEQNSN